MTKVLSALALLVALAFTPAHAQSIRRHGWVRADGAASASAVAAAPSRSLASSRAQGLAGSWLVNLTNGEGIAFKALFTFAKDGTIVASTEGDVCCGYSSTGQHGAWVKDGRGAYTMTFVHLGVDAATGEPLDVAYIHFTITLESANEWNSTWTAEDYDADGILLGTDAGTARASRINAR